MASNKDIRVTSSASAAHIAAAYKRFVAAARKGHRVGMYYDGKCAASSEGERVDVAAREAMLARAEGV